MQPWMVRWPWSVGARWRSSIACLRAQPGPWWACMAWTCATRMGSGGSFPSRLPTSRACALRCRSWSVSFPVRIGRPRAWLPPCIAARRRSTSHACWLPRRTWPAVCRVTSCNPATWWWSSSLRARTRAGRWRSCCTERRLLAGARCTSATTSPTSAHLPWSMPSTGSASAWGGANPRPRGARCPVRKPCRSGCVACWLREGPAVPEAPPLDAAPQASLDLGVVGNGSVAALIDAQARIVWCCLPRFDADASFCALLSPRLPGGDWCIELEDFDHAEQSYLPNTAVLVTRMFDRHGGGIEVVDFAPRYRSHGRVYHPVLLARRVSPICGSPRVRVRLRPLCDYGARTPEKTSGSNHIRYLLSGVVQRLTSDVAVPLIERELPFALDRPAHFVFGPDETLTESPAVVIHLALERTLAYWHEWTRSLYVPFEWQEAVIRAAITLKLCQYEATGAIIAALTTSIPEAAGSARNWDYRYCWLRDAAFTVRALNRLGATRSMEEYIRYVFNLVATDHDTEIGPVFGITFERELPEREVESL